MENASGSLFSNNAHALQIDESVFKLIPAEIVFRYNIIPLEVQNNSIVVGHSHENAMQLCDELSFVLGRNVILKVLSQQIIQNTIAKYFPANPRSNDSKAAEPEMLFDKINSNENDDFSEISVIQIVNKIIHDAIHFRASDIHVEPYENRFRVRYRIDGILQEIADLPLSKRQAIISRLKIMAELDIAEKRRPQDGRIRVTENDKTVDIRVSTLPTDFGEKVVLRILDKTALNLDLNQLGFEARELEMFKSTLDRPYGLILVTGPTGSGKTTTLYAALNYLNTPQRNILTVEDPIEYNLPGINQAHVRSDIGFTFARALRAFLRQDPNVIMVGEIRDLETAEIAVRAALTGHLVLSTIHTNDAPSTISRLIDMGLEPFLISASLKLVIAQRLVRRVCPKCSVAQEMEFLGAGVRVRTRASERGNAGEGQISETRELGDLHDFKGGGCEHCYQTGYKGRMALFEMMPVTESLAEMISRGNNAAQLRAKAIDEGMQNLRENGVRKIVQGLTTVEEVLRETV